MADQQLYVFPGTDGVLRQFFGDRPPTPEEMQSVEQRDKNEALKAANAKPLQEPTTQLGGMLKGYKDYTAEHGVENLKRMGASAVKTLNPVPVLEKMEPVPTLKDLYSLATTGHLAKAPEEPGVMDNLRTVYKGASEIPSVLMENAPELGGAAIAGVTAQKLLGGSASELPSNYPPVQAGDMNFTPASFADRAREAGDLLQSTPHVPGVPPHGTLAARLLGRILSRSSEEPKTFLDLPLTQKMESLPLGAMQPEPGPGAPLWKSNPVAQTPRTINDLPLTQQMESLPINDTGYTGPRPGGHVVGAEPQGYPAQVRENLPEMPARKVVRPNPAQDPKTILQQMMEDEAAARAALGLEPKTAAAPAVSTTPLTQPVTVRADRLRQQVEGNMSPVQTADVPTGANVVGAAPEGKIDFRGWDVDMHDAFQKALANGVDPVEAATRIETASALQKKLGMPDAATVDETVDARNTRVKAQNQSARAKKKP